jgi:hypothetical protein
LCVFLRKNPNARFSQNSKDFYERYKASVEKEKIKNKNRRVKSTMDHMAEEFDFKKDFEQEFRNQISEQMIKSIKEDPLEAESEARKAMLKYIEEQKKSHVNLNDIFSSENRVLDADKGQRLLQSRFSRVDIIE